MAKRFTEYRRSERLSWANVDRDVVLAVAEVCDGHTIFKPEAFTRVGAPPAIIAQYTACYESNFSNPKETIFRDDGEAMNQCLGVYGLRLIEAICRDLGVEYEPKLGRGSQATACYVAIRNHFGVKEVANG